MLKAKLRVEQGRSSLYIFGVVVQPSLVMEDAMASRAVEAMESYGPGRRGCGMA